MTQVFSSGRLRWIVAAVGVGLLGVLFVQIGTSQILSLLRLLGANILVIMALFACHECLRAVAVGFCFPSEVAKPGLRQRLTARFLGEVAGTLTRMGPFVAEPSRAWLMTGRELSGTHVYAAAAGEFIFNACASSIVTIAAILLTYSEWVANGPIRVLSLLLLGLSVAHVAIVFAALLFRLHVIGVIVRVVCRLPIIGHRIRAEQHQVRQVEDALFRALADRPDTLALVMCLELLAQATLVAEVFWTLRSMGVEVSMRSALLVHALGQGVGLIQFVGVTEAGYAVVFKWLGMTAAVGFASSLVKTIRSLATSGLGLLLLMRSRRTWVVQRVAQDGSNG